MARLDCFKGPDVSRMTHEWERDTREDGSWAFTPSSKIDPARTAQNYRMGAGRADARLSVRLSDPGLKVDKRKHVNHAGVWVVTCPQELKDDPDAVRRFFELVYGFTKERYGAENVLQGYVHMDETTPHIHMPVVPVRDGRVSAKAVFNRQELRTYQRELDKAVAVEFGRKGLILNGRTKGGYTTAELKERTRQEAELKQKVFQANGDVIFAEAKAFNARQEAEKAHQEAQEARRRAEADAEGIRAAARQEAARTLQEAQEARQEAQADREAQRAGKRRIAAQEARTEADREKILREAEQEAERMRAEARHGARLADAFNLSFRRRHDQDAAKLKEREAEVARREQAVADREAALDAVGRAMLQRRQEAQQRRQAERDQARAMDGENLLAGMRATFPGVPGHGPKGR